MLNDSSRKVVVGLAWTVSVLAALDLAGWLLHIPILTSFLPHYATMKPDTAIGLALVALALPNRLSTVRWRCLLADFALLIAFLLSCGSLLEYLLHRNLGLDQLFIHVPPDSFIDPAGRMSLATASSLTLTSVAVYLLKRWPKAGIVALLGGGIISVSAIVGYLFHAGPIPAVPWFRSMALHTASCLILLQVAGLAVRPEREPVRSLINTGSSPGYKGWLLLGVTVLPILLALPLLAGMRVGLFDAPFAMALLVVVLMSVQTFILWQDNLALERAEARRLQAEQVLLQSEKLAVVGRLAASIAHEINNPLEAVGNLLYLIGSAESLPEVAGYVRTAEDELARASQITTQTLSFYRDDRRKTFCSPQDTVESAVKLLSSKIQAAGVTVAVDSDNLSHDVRCKDGELRQVLINLLSNAMEAAPGGHIRVRARASRTWPAPGTRGVRILVADDGSGISADAQTRIFEPFFTTKADLGNGLGLWVARNLVEQHGGFLHMRSTTRAGRTGTVFCLFLPLAS